MADEHLNPHRVWALIRDKGMLSPEQSQHLTTCALCHAWLVRFTTMARRAGFSIALQIPPHVKSKTGTDG